MWCEFSEDEIKTNCLHRFTFSFELQQIYVTSFNVLWVDAIKATPHRRRHSIRSILFIVIAKLLCNTVEVLLLLLSTHVYLGIYSSFTFTLALWEKQNQMNMQHFSKLRYCGRQQGAATQLVHMFSNTQYFKHVMQKLLYIKLKDYSPAISPVRLYLHVKANISTLIRSQHADVRRCNVYHVYHLNLAC